MMIEIAIALFLVGFIIASSILYRSIYLVRQAEAIVIERLGKFNRVLTPGLHIVAPFFESPRSFSWTYFKELENKRYYKYIRQTDRIDLREAVYDFPKQSVITKDNVTMEISALLYYQITDPKAAVYEVANLPEALEKLTQTTLRNVVGSMDLDESLVSRDRVNSKLRLILDDAADKWGVKVNRVELQEVNPPADIRHAMEKQMRAERDRRAIILESEGSKQSAILEAEGKRQAAILSAQGTAEALLINAQSEAEARLKIAEAEARSLQLLTKTAGENAIAYSVALQYIKTLPHITQGKDSKLVVVPYEASSLIGALSSLGAVFQESKE